MSVLRQIEVLSANSKSLDEPCKSLSITPQSYYRWRKMYEGMESDQAKQFKALEQENARLKKLVADLALREAMLQEVLKGNF